MGALVVASAVRGARQPAARRASVRAVWRRRYPEVAPDPKLDPYRRGIARLYDGEELTGHLATKVLTWATATGPWWRRRLVDAREVPEWLLTFDPGWGSRHWPGTDFQDGSAEDLPGSVAEWDAGRWSYNRWELRVVWLSGDEAATAWHRYGWD